MAKSKSKKKGLSEAKLKKPPPKKPNPFEFKVNNQKFNVIGRKSKFERGMPGVSRSKAIKKRKHTLLQEYKLKDKSNTFLDRRIGERNRAMTAEDKIMARFTAEQMKAQKKKTMFNLAEDEEILTHKGISISEAERFDDPRDLDDEEDDGATGGLGGEFVEAAHFGGGMLTKGTTGRESVIAELIAESKKRKAERQQAKEKTLELTERLDTEWRDLVPLVHSIPAPPNPEPKTSGPMLADPYDTALKMLRFEARGNPTDKLKSEEDIAAEEAKKLEQLEQERLRRMKGEDTDVKVTTIKHRSADDLDDGFGLDSEQDFSLMYDDEGNAILPSSKKDNSDEEIEEESGPNDNKTNLEGEEESAEEENEEEEEEGSEEEDDLSDLQIASNEENEDDDSSEEEEISETVATSAKQDGKNKNESYDESGLEKYMNISENKTKQLGSVKAKFDSESNCSEDKNDLEAKSRRAAIKSDKKLKSSLKTTKGMEVADNSKSTVQESQANMIITENLNQKTEKSKVKFSNEVEKVTYGENASKIGKQSSEEIREMLQKKKELMEKARKELPYTFPAPENYQELETLLEGKDADQVAVVIERIIKCHHPSLKQENKSKMVDLFAYLMQHLNDMDPKECWRRLERLAPLLYDLSHFNPAAAADCLVDVLKEKQGDYSSKRQKYPSCDTLVFLKLVPILFPPSDKRHIVTTPAMVFILQLLQTCKVTTRRSISSGLFLVSLLYEFVSQSKRFCPQALNFLHGVISTASPPIVHQTSVVPPFTSSHRFLFLHDSCPQVDDLKMAVNDLCNHEKVDNQFRVRSIYSALALVDLFADLYKTHSAIHVAFEPLSSCIGYLQLEKYPKELSALVESLKNKLELMTPKVIESVSREQQKPKALRLYEPCIEPVYETKRSKSGNSEKAEREKLLHKYKREMKGAIREIRRDTSFISSIQYKQKAASDAERKRKVDEIIRWGAEQQNEANRAKKKIKSKF